MNLCRRLLFFFGIPRKERLVSEAFIDVHVEISKGNGSFLLT